MAKLSVLADKARNASSFMWGQPIIIIICFHLDTILNFFTYRATVIVLACTASALDVS